MREKGFSEEQIDEFYKGEGFDPAIIGEEEMRVLGSTQKESGKVLINLYKGARPDTVIEEFYGDAYKRLTPEERKVFKQFYKESNSELTEQEFFEKEGTKFYAEEGLYKNTTVQKIFHKIKQMLNDIIGKSTLPKEVRKMWTDAGYAKVKDKPITQEGESFQLSPQKLKVDEIARKLKSKKQTTRGMDRAKVATRKGYGEILKVLEDKDFKINESLEWYNEAVHDAKSIVSIEVPEIKSNKTSAVLEVIALK